MAKDFSVFLNKESAQFDYEPVKQGKDPNIYVNEAVRREINTDK